MQSERESEKAGQDLLNVSRELEKQVKKLIVLFTGSGLVKAAGPNEIPGRPEFPQRKRGRAVTLVTDWKPSLGVE